MTPRSQQFLKTLLAILAGVLAAYVIVPMVTERWLSLGIGVIVTAAVGAVDTANEPKRRAFWITFGAAFLGVGVVLAA